MSPIKPEHKARYPPDWDAIRARLLEAAGHRCQWCGARNGEPHPKTGAKVVLTMAHVYDKRPESVDEGNLAMLCQKCHNRHDNAGRRMGAPLPPPGPMPVQVPPGRPHMSIPLDRLDDMPVCDYWPTCQSDDPDDVGCDDCRAHARQYADNTGDPLPRLIRHG